MPDAGMGYDKFHIQAASWPVPWAGRWSSCASLAVILEHGVGTSLEESMASCHKLLADVAELLVVMEGDDIPGAPILTGSVR